VANRLTEAGIVHFREEDNLDATKLYKVQWKERVQVAGQISELPEHFYPKLRRYLTQSKNEISKHPEKIQDYQKTKYLADDIVNSRLKKIVTLSSGPVQPEQTMNKLTAEEQLVYLHLTKIISKWRTGILQHDAEE
jgi:DNA replication initiation complex subunit (GINS family)